MIIGDPSAGKSPALKAVLEPIRALERQLRADASVAHGAAGDTPIPQLTIGDATIEAVGLILSDQPKGTLLVRDELAGFFGDMNRYNNGSGDRPFWLEAYGGGTTP